jgi:hypothetical protein
MKHMNPISYRDFLGARNASHAANSFDETPKMLIYRIIILALVGLLLNRPCGGHEDTLHRFLADQPLAPQGAPDRQPSTAAICQLGIELSDKRSGGPLPGLVRVKDIATGRWVALETSRKRPRGWYSVPATTTIAVPQAELEIEACHGIETEVFKISLNLAGSPTHQIKLPLRRFYDPAAKGLVAGNTHLHMVLNEHDKMGVLLKNRAEAETYLRAASKSDGLDLVYVSYLIRGRTHYVSNDFSRRDLESLSDDEVHFTNGEECRHEGRRWPGEPRFSYGHVMFLDIPRLVEPVSLGETLTDGNDPTDAIPLNRGIRQAKADGGTVIWCHGTQGLEDVPSWVSGLVDAQNIYDGGNEGTFDSIYYPYLNAGLRIPFSTGTDWGLWDFSRVYVPLPGPTSSKAFLAALAQGQSYVTNGTFVEFDVDGHLAGDTIEASRGQQVRIHGRGLGQTDFRQIEVVFNGEILHSAGSHRAEEHFEAAIDFSFTVAEPGWLALRIPTDRDYDIRSNYKGPGTNLLGKVLFAHTSPIYVRMDGRSVFKQEAAEQLIADMKTSIRQIQFKGTFNDDTEREAVLRNYRDAIDTLEARLQSAKD